MTHESQDQDQIAVQARRWVSLLGSGNVEAAERERFMEWLAADARHAQAYQKSHRVWTGLGQLGHLRETLQPEELKPVDDVAAARTPETSRHSPALRRWALAATVVLALLVPLYWNFALRTPADQTSVYATRSAEIRDITLLDGSVVTLGAHSSIRTSFNTSSRNVELLSGAAFFAVAHDVERPFFVKAEDAVIRVVGTQFEVHRGMRALRVAVVQGRVEVTRHNMSPSASSRSEVAQAVLSGGQTALLDKHNSTIEPIQTPVARASASWRSGRLEYIDAPLSEVIADLNRYRTAPIRIASEEVGEMRITGSFRTDRLDQMLRFLSSSLPLELQSDAGGNLNLTKRPAHNGASDE